MFLNFRVSNLNFMKQKTMKKKKINKKTKRWFGMMDVRMRKKTKKLMNERRK